MFTFKDGTAERTLLGSTIVGNGAAVRYPGQTMPMVIRQGDAAPIDPVAHEAELKAYLTYYKGYYDSAAVDRHFSALIQGGTPVSVGLDATGAFLTSAPVEQDTRDWAGHIETAVRAQHEIRLWARINPGDLQRQAAVKFTRDLAGAYADGEVEVLSVETKNKSLWRTTSGGMDTTASVAPLRDALGTFFGTSSTSWNETAALRNTYDWSVPGYIHVIGYYRISEEPLNDQVTTQVVTRIKVKGPCRLAYLEHRDALYMSTQANSTAQTVRGLSSFYPVFWVRKTVNGEDVLGVYPAGRITGGTIYKDQDKDTMVWKGGYGFTYTIDGQGKVEYNYPVRSADYCVYADGSTSNTNVWYFPTTFTPSSSSVYGATQRTWLKAGALPFVDRVLATMSAPSWINGWVPAPKWGTAVASRAINGEGRVPIGTCLNHNPCVEYRVYLSELPAPSPLGPEMAAADTVLRVLTRLKSEQLSTLIDGLGEAVGPSVLAFRNDLDVNPRVFYGWLGPDVVRPPLSTLAQTEVQQMAQEAGQSIYDEFLIPKDDDDPASTGVTFKQADNACNSFRESATSRGRRAVCVIGPTTRYNAAKRAGYVGFVSGALKVYTSAAGDVEMTDEQIDEFYAGLVAGYQINRTTAAASSSVLNTYSSPYGATRYPAWYDYVTDTLFGTSYGAITAPVSEGKSADPKYTVEGNSDQGFVKDPAQWTPEFWLVVCGSKAWRVEETLGTLLTNPFGVGGFKL